MSKTINDLRMALFKALDSLTDDKNPMDIERARAVSEVAQTIINSAKVEIEHLKIAGGKSSGFIPEQPDTSPALPNGTAVVGQKPGVTVTRHTLK